jgi:2-polyprenyl-6-methoxyphenol hydroxylase-like FAD-dependent oxidoreductase
VSIPSDSDPRELRTDVLIVGAGPTGLALATTLARAGVPHLLVDRLEAGQNTSRAAVIHAHTLEVLDRIGVADRLSDVGVKLGRFCLRDRDRTLLRLRFDALPSRMAFLLMLPQDVTESVLEQALGEAGGSVRRSCTLESLVDGADGAIATIRSGDALQRVRARYVVGADGMHSVVRQSAGIGFPGGSYEESFLLADVRMDWPLPRDEVSLFFSPAGLLVVAPLPGGAFRIVATLDDAPKEPDVACVQALVDAHGPARRRGTVGEVLWGSRFRVHHRVAERYRRGRILLVGDAAHVHSPAGGQGMNTGLVDACVLGQLLSDVVAGRRAEDALDRYGELRRPAAMEVLALAGRLTALATLKSAPLRLLRNCAFRLLDLVPMARRRIAMNLSGLSRRAAAEVR